tara:strand:- start:28 stop:681 length:654 start_codon:yes stop_codon:yes gene_type:complete
MASLAETLRQVGYVTPQGVTGPNAPLARQLKNYVTNVIPTAAQNLAQQRADIDASLTMGDQGIQVGDREAFERQMAQVPNLMGSTNVTKQMSWEIPKKPKNSILVDIPLNTIEHGESAMAGGKLTWPTAKQTIKEYADKKTDFPPIEIMGNDPNYEFFNKPFMIYDGSHRYEAAKLRGDKSIKAYISKDDADALKAYEQLKNSRKQIIEQELKKVVE